MRLTALRGAIDRLFSYEEPNMALIPDSHAGILDTKALLYLGTQNKDGSPQVSPVWFVTNGDIIEVNSAKGRLKDLNMRARPRCVDSHRRPGKPLQMGGDAGYGSGGHGKRGGGAHRFALAKKYLGVDSYPNRQEGQVRVIYRIRANKVFTMGA